MIETIFSLLQNQIFQTIISALLIFIVSQFFLELYLKPKVEIKKAMATLSEKLLFYHAEIVNGILTNEHINEIQNASSRLLAVSWIFYKRSKKQRQFLDIAKTLNLVVAASKSNSINLDEAVRAFMNLRKYKFLKIDYRN